MNTVDKIFEMVFGIITFTIDITCIFILNFILCILFLLPLTLIVFPFNRNHKYKTPLYALKIFYIYTFKYKAVVL